MSSLVRLLHSGNLIRCIAKRATKLPTSNPRYVLFYKTKRNFSGDEIESIVVPNLGDSITEGTVTSILKQLGEQVATDDVVLEIETDKVSVDIRAPKDGYIAKFFAEIDQDVEVGAPLYALSAKPVDGIDPASITPPKPTETKTESAPQTTAAPSPPSKAQSAAPQQPTPISTAATSTSHRVPMIRFKYGEREEIDKLIFGISTPSSSVGKGAGAPQLEGDTMPFWELPARFRHREWAEMDIDAVNSGGATLAERKKSNYD